MLPHRILCLSVSHRRPGFPRPLPVVLSTLLALLLAACCFTSAAQAQSVTLAADAASLPVRTALHLTASAGVGATGTVTFLDGNAALATLPLSLTGSAVYASAILASGTHALSAAYSGDQLHPSASSPPVQVTVTTIPPPAFTVAPGRGTLFTSQPLGVFTLGLPPDATGSITLLDDGSPVGSVPIVRASGPAYLSLGDDIPAGATLASPALAFPSLLAAEHAFALTGKAVVGQSACDLLVQQLNQPLTQFTQAGAPLTTLMASVNDTANPATEPVFQLCHQAALAWLAIPREFKVLARDPGASTISGPWAFSPTLSTLYNNSSGGTAQFSITSTGAPLYVWYLLDRTVPGLFTVTLDGIPDPTVYNAQPLTGPNTDGGLGFALLRIPVAAGPHVLQFTLQSGALGILAVGTPPSTADGSLHPTVLVSDMPNQNQAAPRDPAAILAQFSADIEANVALLAADGLDVRLVSTRNTMPGSPDAMSDAVHPNALGHTQLAAAFDALLPGVSAAGITTFQPNTPFATVLLPTSGVRTLKAVYSGDSVFAPAVSEPFSVSVHDGTTATTLTTPNLSIPYKASVPFTATVDPPTTIGDVNFYANGTRLTTMPLSNGSATMSQGFETGLWAVTASVVPYDGHAPSTSAALIVDAGRRNPSFSFSAQMQGQPQGQLPGQLQGPASAPAAVLAAYLAPDSASGSVTFTDSQTGLLASVPVLNGAAILPIPSLAPGTHTYTAAYSGDSVYAPLSSAPAAITAGPLPTSLLATLLSSPDAPVGSPTRIHVDVLAPAVPLVPSTPASFSPAMNATTVFMGDSITAWWPLPAHDLGIAGQTTAQMLPRFADGVLNQGFERVVILGGTNDTIRGVDPSTTIANLAAMAAQAAAAGIRPILATITPLSNPQNDLSVAVFTLNAAIRSLAQQNGYALLDYFAALVQHPELFPDHIHPNLAGYALMETVLAQTLLPPGGNVTLSDGTSASLSASGTATLESTLLPAGPQQLTVAFAGNASFAPAFASIQADFVQAASATTLDAQPLAGYAGNAVAFTASVSTLPGQGSQALAPTGTVIFFDNGRRTGTANLVGAHNTVTSTVSNLSPGSHVFTAIYAGDTNFTSSTSTPTDLTSPFTNTALALSTAAPTAVAGTAVTLTASLTPASATGTVTFMDGNSILAQLPLAGGQAAFTTSTLALGPHDLTAVYSGDPDDSIASSPVLALTILPSPTTLTLAAIPPTQPAGTSTRLSVSVTPVTASGAITFVDTYTAPGQTRATLRPLGQATLASASATLTATLPVGTHLLSAAYAGDPANLPSASATIATTITPLVSSATLTTLQSTLAFGTPASFTVTVSPATATGTVTLRDSSGSALAQATLRNATATFSLTDLQVGLHTVSATYAGDLDDTAATSPVLSITITPAPTTLTLAPVAAQLPAGSPVTLTASISPATASGSITFRDPSAGTLGQAALVSGSATLTLASLPVAAYRITAVYSGDANDAPSLSNSTATTIVLTPTVTTLAPPPAQLLDNTPLTLIASTSPVPASGSLTFFDGAAALGTAPLVHGTATLQLPSLPLGSHSLRAGFAGDPLLAASSSPPATLTVTAATTSTTVLTLAQLTIADGDPIAFNVQVAGPNRTSPTGTVTIKSGGQLLASGTLTNGQGSRAFATLTAASTLLGPGTYAATAFYAGDPTNAASDTSATPVAFSIVRPPTVLSFLPAAAVLPAHTPVLLAATVTGPGPAQVPTGTVTFLLNGTAVLTTPVDSAGNASATLPGQPVGTYTLTAAYNPTGVFAPASASGQTLTVTPPLSLAFPNPTLAMGPASQAGATLLITPLSGFTGTVAAQCSTSVPFLTCTLDPLASVSTPTSAVVHITLANATASTSSQATAPLILAALLLLPLAGRRAKRRLPLLLIALACLASSVTGCATGGNFNSIPSGYQLVTVTVTANQTATHAFLNIQITD